MSDDAKAIGEDSEPIGITKRSVDVELLGIGTGSSLRGHEAIGHEVRVDIRFVLVISF